MKNMEELRNMKKICLLSMTLLLVSSLSWAGQYQVIVNEKINAETITSANLKAIYAGNMNFWPTGERVRAARLNDESSLTTQFLNEVMQNTLPEFLQHWRHKLFAGRALPPKKVENDADMIRFVKEYEGAIGFVSNGTNTKAAGVKSIRVTE